MATVKEFTDRYRNVFATGRERSIGAEKELIVVDRQGANAMADCSAAMQQVYIEGFSAMYDDVNPWLVTGFASPDGSVITTDAGLGTAELVTPPCRTVAELAENHELILAAFKRILPDAFTVLPIGFQPRTGPAWWRWVKKGRYEAMREGTGGKVMASCVSASFQDHVSVDPDEAVTALNAANGAAGFLIALFANASIYLGGPNGYKAKRELVWDDFGPDYQDRVGMLDRPFSDLEDYVAYLFERRLIFYRERPGVWLVPWRSFGDLVREKTVEEAFEFWKYHEGSFWPDARLRVYGTVEIRPCCPQPRAELYAVDAAALGLVENRTAVNEWLGQFSWTELKAFRLEAIEHGLEARIAGRPSLPLIREFLDLVTAGLAGRPYGEASFLDATRERVFSDRPWTWADRTRELFFENGIDRLIDAIKL